MDCAKAVAVMPPDVPRSGAAHGKAGENDAVRIDGVIRFDRFDRFKNINLSGVFPPDAVPPEGMENDGLLLVFEEPAKRLTLLAAMVEKLEIRRLVRAPPEPDEQRNGATQIELLRDLKTIGLVGIIDPRAITADDETFLSEPRTLVLFVEKTVAAVGKIKHFRRERDFFFRIKFIVA